MNLRKLQEANGRYYQACYQDGLEQGRRRRAYLLQQGLSLETMYNNRYQGKTFRGLYGYMDGMNGS